MSNQQHTTGQWINRTVGDSTDRNGTQIYSGQLHIATCHYGSNDTPDYERCVSNARLIAAAPELMAALEEAECVLRRIGADTTADFAKAAIAKVKGGAA